MPSATQEDKYGNTSLAKWELTTADPTGSKIARPGAADRSVQVFGTFGGATVRIEGSLDGGTNWAPVHDPGGVAVTFTAAGLNAISENVGELRAVLSPAGTDAAVTVLILSRSTR
jgi:hypothetical protein